MKLKAEDLRQAKSMTITGQEPWLAEIYASFDMSLAEAQGEKAIVGSVTITPQPYGVYAVSGNIRFVPKVSCSRCEDPIPWPIERTFAVRFLEVPELPDDAVEDEEDREPAALDDYYLDSEGLIDIEMLLNDFIQTALPMRLVRASEDGKSCLVCKKAIDTREVFSVGNKEDMSPFAALKSLKIPKD